jgi:hypothetical protein
MKNKKFLFGMLAVALVFASVLGAGCSKKDSGSASWNSSAAQTVDDAVGKAADDLVAALGSTAAGTVDAVQQVSSGLAAAVGSTASSSKSAGSAGSASSVNWSKALDEYEKFVNEYVTFMKKYKANPSDMTLLAQSASMMEKAQKAVEAVEKVQGELSAADLAKFTARYTKLATKMAQAAL